MQAMARRVYFLDTNIAHWCRIFIDTARQASAEPSTTGREALQDIYKKKLRTKKAIDNVEQGRAAFQALATAQMNGAIDVLLSSITLLELHHGTLRGKALLNACSVDTPRMWSQFGEGDAMAHLGAEDYEDAIAHSDCLLDEFRDAGLMVRDISDHRQQETLQFSRRVFRSLYLSVCDCIIYAGAMMEQADYLVTSDGHLFTVAGGLANIGEPPPHYDKEILEKARKMLLQDYRQITGNEGDEGGEPAFPVPVKPRSVKNCVEQ